LLKNPEFEYIKWDINDPFSLDQFQELERFKVKFQGVQEVYHLACPTSPKKFDEFKHQTLLANSIGMRNVLDVAVKFKAKFLQASTSVVYGERPEDGHPFKEEEVGVYDHLTPRGCYDEGKRFAETMCATYKDVHGLDTRIARIFRTYGPRMALSDGHMIPDFVLDAIEGKDLVIYGDEDFRSSFVFVDDVVDAMAKMMGEKENSGPVNIGSDYDIKIVDIAKKVIEMIGSRSGITYKDPLPFMRPLGIPDLTGSRRRGGSRSRRSITA
jgi:UDP-glucuronate decarboxylase